MIFYAVWAAFSIPGFFFGRSLLKKGASGFLFFVAVYLMSQPFSWSLIGGGSYNAVLILPVPDLLAMLFFAREARMESLPPPPISTVVVYAIALSIAIARRGNPFKRTGNSLPKIRLPDIEKRDSDKW